MSFLTETVSVMARHGQGPDTIKFIGSSDGTYSCDWATFVKLADFEYDGGYGTAQVARNLVIVFKDKTWLSRGEYDGSEWWDYNKVPKWKRTTKPIVRLWDRWGGDLESLAKEGKTHG